MNPTGVHYSVQYSNQIQHMKFQNRNFYGVKVILFFAFIYGVNFGILSLIDNNTKWKKERTGKNNTRQYMHIMGVQSKVMKRP